MNLIGLLCLFLGLLLVRKTLMVFGFDYMALVYLYYPEESEVQQHNIYSILRHPTYFAVILTAFGGWLITLSFYSFTSFLLLFLGFNFHLQLVEEKELIQRSGDSYLEYQKKVPGLLLRPLVF